MPQVVLALIVPITVLVAVLTVDWVSAAIMVVTLPLVPVFMALVGMETQARTDRQLRSLQLLAGHFLDVVTGLTTLKIFGRSRAQLSTIRKVADSYRQKMMATLRVTFLSSLVLELLSSVSVALVAVAIGLRLLNGHLSLRTSLFVLVLAPEAYLPLRQLAAEYHASAEGVGAAQQVFDVLDQPLAAAPAPGRTYPTRPKPVYSSNLSATPTRGANVPGARRRNIGSTPGRAGRARPVRAGAASRRCWRCCSDLYVPTPGRWSSATSTSMTSTPTNGESGSPGCRSARTFSRPPLPTMSALDGRLRRRVEVRSALDAAGLSALVARLPQGVDTMLGERRRGAIGRRTTARCPRSRLPPRRTAVAAGRAHGQPRRRYRGGCARSDRKAGSWSDSLDGGPPP